CVQCHEARGIFNSWGITSEYLEKNQTEPIPITCGVCHDPHDRTNPKQLRFPIDEPNEDTNLCMKCHHKRGVPEANSSRGPHSPQGPLLLGTAGWRPPNFTFQDDTIISTHGSAANPRMCATCHVTGLEITDQETGAFVFNSTGHLFRAIPCLDAQGIPVPTGTCAIAERNFGACATSGCHGTPASAQSAFSVTRNRLDVLVARLNGQLGQIPLSEFNSFDNTITTAEGARFNSELGAMSGSTAHNPLLVEALLVASINQIELDYGIVPGPAPSGADPNTPEFR
ncbi:MAG: cytochrome c3 family protein, partial [Gemmatimonadota bacterium]|nr:cytochrome c3 family protein [Gemmatimonadota bacterium]